MKFQFPMKLVVAVGSHVLLRQLSISQNYYGNRFAMRMFINEYFHRGNGIYCPYFLRQYFS